MTSERILEQDLDDAPAAMTPRIDLQQLGCAPSCPMKRLPVTVALPTVMGTIVADPVAALLAY